jgi:hypothetical protein
MQQQAALMAAATAQGTYINPMAALATQIPHATLNGMANPVVPPTSGKYLGDFSRFCLDFSVTQGHAGIFRFFLSL